MNLTELTGMTALVTGASGDIGRAISKKLCSYGAGLVLWDIDREGLQRASIDLDHKCHVDCLDITNPDAISAAAANVESTFGGLDILVNCAGIVHPHKLTWTLTPELFHEVLNVNLTGAFLCIRAFVPQLLDRQETHGRARIVNMTSYLGCEPQGFDSAYAASKAGLIALTKSLARELAPNGLLVNCVAPTVVESRMGKDVPTAVLQEKLKHIPLGRLARADEVASMVAWLCSSECSFTTGGVFDVSGGRASN